MEAARVAAMRGHKVTLYEKQEKLGGYLVEALVPRFKNDLVRLRDYLITQLKKAGVKEILKTEATAEMLEKEGFDAVVVATGSKPLIPKVRGIDTLSVTTGVDVMRGKRIGQNITVIGGGLVGCETALFLAEAGKNVRIVEKNTNHILIYRIVSVLHELLQYPSRSSEQLPTGP